MKYFFCNKPSKGFFKRQMSRDKPILLLAIKNLPFSQPVFTCSKLPIETLEEGVKYVHS